MNIDETIEFSKSCITDLFKSSIDINTYGYLFQDFVLNKNYHYRIECDRFYWKQINEVKENKNDWWTYFVTLQLNFEGIVIVQDSENVISKKNKKFKLFVDLWFKTDKIQFTYRILDQKYKVIKDYVQQIEELNAKKGIYSLLNGKVKCNNNFLAFAKKITGKKRHLKVSINDFKIDDIARISQDLKYLYGEILQISSYLGNYISNPQRFNGKVYYNYHSSFIDKRYFFLISVMFETLYNYWDKIGDLLAIYFTPKLNPDRIYFTTVIDYISTPYDKSTNYLWLKDFRENQYKLLNNERIQVVHYKNIESKFHELYSSKYDNKAELERLQNEKIELKRFLGIHHQYTFDGFEKAFLLIDEIK